MDKVRAVLEGIYEAGQYHDKAKSNEKYKQKDIKSAHTQLDALYKEFYLGMLPSEEEIKNIGIDLVDEYFPKGDCKERGQAIVLYAMLIIKFNSVIQEIERRING